MVERESNLQLAMLWIALKDIQGRIDNEAIPLGMHLGIEDPELMKALETLSERIGLHFTRWTLRPSWS